jgi:hypothetical protein
MRLVFVGGSLGRHRALSPGAQVVLSVASWFTRGTSVFRGVAGKTVGCGNVSVLGGTGRGWLRDGGSMPCQRACSAVRGGVLVHGNGAGALGALGVADASKWCG